MSYKGGGIGQYACKQMFRYDSSTQQIKTMPEISSAVDGGQCVSAERIRPAETGLDPLDRQGPGAYRTRFAHMLRSIKSVGFNGLAILNVDACIGDNLKTLESESLKNMSKNVGYLFLKYGIRPYWTVCYAAPVLLANISSNPENPAAEQWWAAKAAEIKSLFPTFGGLLVKADCEGKLVDLLSLYLRGSRLAARSACASQMFSVETV